MQPDTQKVNMTDILKAFLDASLTKEEFVKAFENVVKKVQSMEERNTREIQAMQQTVAAISQKLASDVASKLGAVRNGTDGKDGVDGEDGLDGSDGKDGTSPDPKDVAKLVVKGLDLSPLYDKLERELQDIRSKVQQIPERPTFSFIPGRSIPRIFVIDLSDQLNGSTKSFALPTNFGIIAVNGSSAPFGAFRPVVDYTQVGKNLVFDPSIDAPSALAAGQSLTITILK